MENTSNIKHHTSMQVKLSIVVPVYNVEQYLRKCVDSLLNQDLDNYEIIFVDDGSTDNSGAICDEIATHYTLHITQPFTPSSVQPFTPSSVHPLTPSPLIRVIHQPNAGLSAARNSGIEIAQGEYIMFVDSDDYIEPNVLGGLMAQIERDNLDVLRYNYKNVNEQYEEFHPNKDPKRDVNYSESVVDGETFLNERLGPACYTWQFILRRDIIYPSTLNNQHSTLFTEGIYFEDVDWTPRMLIRAKRVASTSTIVYNYLWRTGSITLPTSPQKREKVLHDKILYIRGFQKQCKLVQDPKWFVWMTSFSTMSILGSLVHLPSIERKKYISELRSLNIFPLSTFRANRNERIKIFIANISPSLYCKLMSIRAKR